MIIIYSLCIETCIVPDALKVSKVTSMYRSGDPTNASNYTEQATSSSLLVK